MTSLESLTISENIGDASVIAIESYVTEEFAVVKNSSAESDTTDFRSENLEDSSNNISEINPEKSWWVSFAKY